MAIFILTTPTLPSPIKGEGEKGRGRFQKGGDARHRMVGEEVVII
jgi:hypothetical protein